ncbi:hypothetical protein [Labrenzia sp. DG1229]|uniref:hypothetical protein n=1 Tax=Labrenzia sp. DG1229 TaxID=681847 RepID=UPI0005670EA0|nr:hypothetical protein [Labrenzia sp. DG1229]
MSINLAGLHKPHAITPVLFQSLSAQFKAERRPGGLANGKIDLKRMIIMLSLPGAMLKPTFQPKWRRPTSAKMIKAWPPIGATVGHVVTEGGFARVAKKAVRNNVWDIIIFNFQTEVPREVNWYLHHAVGCWMSKDKMNFCFDGARTADGKLGRVYIPPKNWMPPSYFKRGSGFGGQVDQHADSAVRLLERLAVHMPSIYHHGTQLPARAYRTVADLIKRRDIRLEIDPSRGLYEAEYVASEKLIYVGSALMLSKPMSYGVIANEATHAFNHYQSNTTNAYHEEVASSMADSIALACMSEDATLARLREGGLKDMLYFAGWVWVNHLSWRRNVTLEDFNGFYDHPITGERRNPKEDFLEYHKLMGYILKIRQYVYNEWEPFA